MRAVNIACACMSASTPMGMLLQLVPSCSYIETSSVEATALYDWGRLYGNTCCKSTVDLL